MVDKRLADKLASVATKQIEAGVKLRQPRLDTIKQIEDLYNNKVESTFDGRINVPIPFMSGHIDTLMGKIDARPAVEYSPGDEADVAIVDKVTAAFRIDSTSMKAAWGRKDRQEKKLALISGRGISKIYAESPESKYRARYEVIDYHDFVCEGTQGHLEDQLYAGQMNIFRTPFALKRNATMGFYDKSQVGLLLARTDSQEYKKNEDLYKNKINRLQSLGLDPESNSYIGQPVINLTEWCMDFEGDRYFLVLDYRTGTWVRAERLVETFPVGEDYETGLYPYVTWATNDEAFAFWTKGAGDDILPVAEGMRIIINQTLTNMMRKNQPQRAVDPSVFPDPNELEWDRPDDIIITNPGKDPSKGVYTFQTPDLTASIDLVQYLDQFLGKKSGVNSDAQGAADKDVKVGVYYGNVQQAADRIGTIEKNYNESYAEKGYRYFWGLKTHCTEGKMVKMIGKTGVKWEELTRGELKDMQDVDVIVTGGTQEAELNAIKQKQQSEALASVTANPEYAAMLSKRWVIENTFRIAGFTDEDIQQALDVESDENREILNEASQAIQMILQGKQPKLNRGANAAFLQKILDFDTENLDYIKLDKAGNMVGIDKDLKAKSDALKAYAEAHYDIVIENTMRKARMQAQLEMRKAGEEMMKSGQFNQPVPTEMDQRMAALRPGEMAPANTPAGTAQQSQSISSTMSP